MDKAGLTRREAAMFLTANGYPISIHTLANFACKGGGPSHEFFGRRTFYKPNELLDWAELRLRPARQDQSLNPDRQVA
jgi:hypothetical protein